MGYRAKNIDTDKAITALRDARDFQRAESETRIREEKAYMRGINKGIYIAVGLFNCSNYEKTATDNWIVKKDSVEATYTCPVCGFEITFADPKEKFEYKGCPMCLSLLGGADNGL